MRENLYCFRFIILTLQRIFVMMSSLLTNKERSYNLVIHRILNSLKCCFFKNVYRIAEQSYLSFPEESSATCKIPGENVPANLYNISFMKKGGCRTRKMDTRYSRFKPYFIQYLVYVLLDATAPPIFCCIKDIFQKRFRFDMCIR